MVVHEIGPNGGAWEGNGGPNGPRGGSEGRVEKEEMK